MLRIKCIILLVLSVVSHQTLAQDLPAGIEPLKLRSIMQDMGENMQAIVDGIIREDYVQVEKNAGLVADHPQPPMTEKRRIKGFFGKKMSQFKGYDVKTHNTARQLAEQAKSGNVKEMIVTFSELQTSCVGCHQAFRADFQKHFYSPN